MITYRLTTEALASMNANSSYGSGEHYAVASQSGGDGLAIGGEKFDPSLHDAYDIDHFSPLGLALDEDYVDVVLPAKPFDVGVLLDGTKRNEHPIVTTVKRDIGTDLMRVLGDRALPGLTDNGFTYVALDKASDRQIGLYDRSIEIDDRSEFPDVASAKASEGLTFIISDFKDMKFEPNSLQEAIAIKVDHVLSRRIPANVGRLVVGGHLEVDTNKPKKLDPVNARLEARHQRTVESLRLAGAQVVSIIANGKLQTGYDTAKADKAIAQAIMELR